MTENTSRSVQIGSISDGGIRIHGYTTSVTYDPADVHETAEFDAMLLRERMSTIARQLAAGHTVILIPGEPR